MGNAGFVLRKKVSNQEIIGYLSSWPGSILEWTEEDLFQFAECFTVQNVAAGKEISIKDPRFFFIVAKGSVEVQAILPTIRKKTGHIREFLCKKEKGDMVYVPSMKKLISDSNVKEYVQREKEEHKRHSEHKKNVFDIIDTVSIKSVVASSILRLDWKKFENNFCDNILDLNKRLPLSTKIDVGMLRIMMKTNLTDYLERLPILADIPHSKLETLVRMCRYRVEKKGSIICKEMDMGDEVFLVLSGKVKVEAMASERMVELFENFINDHKPDNDMTLRKRSVTFSDDVKAEKDDDSTNQVQIDRQTRYDLRLRSLFLANQNCRREMAEDTNVQDKEKHQITRTVELARLGTGDYFGEMATFIGLPRAATVTAVTNVLMASLSKTDFRNLYNTISPNLERNVEKVVKRHMLRNIFCLKSPFLGQLHTAKIDVMAELTSIKKFDGDCVIFNQGDEAGVFYFVYSGSLKVQKQNDGETRDVGFIYPGDYFGELAVMHDTKRLATISTATPSVLLELTRDNFRKCFQDKPELIAEIILRMKGRQVDFKTIMKHTFSRCMFREFLEKEHGAENIMFFDEVDEYTKNFDSMSKEDIESKAENIIKEYLCKNSPSAVNVSSIIYDDASKMLNSKDFSKDLFIEAKDEIVKLMERDPFQRFRRSDIFSKLMKRVRCYDFSDL